MLGLLPDGLQFIRVRTEFQRAVKYSRQSVSRIRSSTVVTACMRVDLYANNPSDQGKNASTSELLPFIQVYRFFKFGKWW